MRRKYLAGLLLALGQAPVLAIAATNAPVMPATSGSAASAVAISDGKTEYLSMKEFVRLISESDEQVLVQRMEADIAAEGVKGAKGIFEPSAFLEAEHSSSHVKNTTSAIAQQAGQSVYYSKDNIFKMGVDWKLVTGADAEVFWNPSRLSNSLQDPTMSIYGTGQPDYQSSLGFKISQPLMRNRGKEVTTTSIRVAEQDERAAQETVRQVLAQRVMDGLVVYFNYQRARERVKYRGEGLKLTDAILRETKMQEKVGLKSQGDVLDAESAMLQRQSQLAQAQQDMEEQQNLFQAFISARERAKGAALSVRRYAAADALHPLSLPDDAVALKPTGPLSEEARKVIESGGIYVPEVFRPALEARPEIRVNSIRMEREAIRTRYAENQKLPEVNLTVRYGIEDLRNDGFRSPSDYIGNVGNNPYNSWAVGVQVRYYLFGDGKRSAELAAANIRRQQVALAGAALKQRIVNELESSAAVLEKSTQTAKRQQEIVTSQRHLLEMEANLVKEGKKSSLDYMRKQLDLLAAEEALSDSTVIANRASFLVSQARGLLLKRLGLE